MDCLLLVGRSLRGAENFGNFSLLEFFGWIFWGKNSLGNTLGWNLYDLLVFLLFVCVFFGYGCDFEDSMGFITMFVSPLLGLDIFGSFSIRILKANLR